MTRTSTPTPTSTPRKRKSHQQRAQEQLAVSARRVERLEKHEAALLDELAVTRDDLKAEKARHEHLAASPDLKSAASADE